MQNKNPTLSIIIPALNEEKHIGNLLDDILINTFKDWEIIVADNGSSDKTVSLVQNYHVKFPNINIFSIDKKGPSIARNHGAMQANGEYLLFLDADVRICETFIEHSLQEAAKRQLDIAGYCLRPNTKRLSDKIMWFALNNFIFKTTQYFFPVNTACGGILVKKLIHEKLSGFDEKRHMAEDHDYVRRASKIGKFRMLKKIKAEVNMRRFDKEGRFIVWGKWFIAVPYYIFGIKMKYLPFKYSFNDEDNQ